MFSINQRGSVLCLHGPEIVCCFGKAMLVSLGPVLIPKLHSKTPGTEPGNEPNLTAIICAYRLLGLGS